MILTYIKSRFLFRPGKTANISIHSIYKFVTTYSINKLTFTQHNSDCLALISNIVAMAKLGHNRNHSNPQNLTKLNLNPKLTKSEHRR